MKIEERTDCEYFEPKTSPSECGSCQTDGHYLCAGCRHIAPFEHMDLADTRMGYYPKQEKERIQREADEELKNKKIAIDFDIKLIKAKLKLPISDKDRQSYEKRLAELQKQKQ